jgi:hypothetical protein
MPEWHGKGQHYRRKTRPREAAQFAKNIAAIAGQANKVKRPHRAPRARPLGTKRPADQTSADSAEITGLVSIRLNLAIGAAAHQRAPHACRCDILARMSRKRWSYRLSRPIPVKDGPTLRTLDDVRTFMLDNLPEDDQARRSWQKACEILLAAADGLADVRAATRQVELGAISAGQVDGEMIRRLTLFSMPRG